MSARAPALLFLAGLLYHGLWALSIPIPEDWDAQYYLLVAQHLAAGDGAVTQSLWNLSVLPGSLPLVADLHWMPLPSRVLVPGLWLWPAHGDQLVTVLLAATWGPLAWALARRLEATPALAMGAGLLATTGGVWVRLGATPDTYALYGALGGLGLLAVAHERPGLAAAVGLAAGLARNDGFLLAPCLALGLAGTARWLVAASGPAAMALWALRNHLLAGGDYWQARRIATESGDYLALYDGALRDPVGLWGRVAAPFTHAAALGEYLVTPGLLVLTLPTFVFAWSQRHVPWVRVYGAAFLGTALAALLAAPEVATHGTLYRSGIALWPAHAALGMLGVQRTAAWAQDVRGYHPTFTRVVLLGGFVIIVLGMGLGRHAERGVADVCSPLAEVPAHAPVFTTEPLLLELTCDRTGVMWTRTTPPDRIEDVAARYGVAFALADDGQILTEGSMTADDVAQRFPAWQPQGPRVFSVTPAP